MERMACWCLSLQSASHRTTPSQLLTFPPPNETTLSNHPTTGSPLSVVPGNGQRAGRSALAPLQIGLTPAPTAAAPANTSAVGCVTLLRRDAPAAGAGGRGGGRGRGRGRRREVVQPDAAIMITTAGGFF
jgi:hypothetical protein